MKVHHIVFSEGGANGAGNGGSHGSKAFFIQSWHDFDRNALIFPGKGAVKLFAADMVAPSVIAGYVVALAHHSGAQFLDYNFHAAFPGRDAFVAQHCNFHLTIPRNFQSCFFDRPIDVQLKTPAAVQKPTNQITPALSGLRQTETSQYVFGIQRLTEQKMLHQIHFYTHRSNCRFP